MTDHNLPQVVLAPEPFTPRAEVLEVPALGQKVSDLVSAAVRQGKLKADADTIRRLRVHVNGVPLPADTPEQRLAAMQYVPQPGEVINLVVVVQGGGGGGDTGKVLQTVLTVAVIALSLYVGGGAATPGFLDAAWIRAAGAATVAVGGQMAISALMGTPETMQSSNDASALKDGSNRYRPRAPMPLVLGRRHWTFDLAAPPFTTTIGQDVFLTLAVAPHYGRCWVGNLKIGETLLSDYPAEDIQVEYFLEPGVPRRSALYPNSVAQENFQDKLDFTGGGVWDVHTALQTGDRLEADVELPSGLRYNSPSSGKVRNEEVAGQIQFAEVGTENWTAATFPGHDTTRDKNGILLPPGSFYLNLKTPDPVRRTFGWTAPDPTKLYKVRMRAYDRDGDFPDQGERTWTTMWTALRSIRNSPPILDQNLATIFIRVRSTDDLNGSLPVISGEVEPIVPVYQGGNWNTEARTSNAAALMRWLLTGPAAATPLEFAEFHSSLETTFQLIEANPSWKGGLLVTEDRSQQDVMVALGKMGRFSTYWNGSKLCFVPDWVRGAPRQVFSGRNAAGYRYRRSFPKPIHAVFIEFSNLDQGSLEDELYVYADGYDASNATLIETLRIDFVCTQERAFQEGRVYLAKRLLQVEMHEWSAGLDAIATTYGDRVLVRHPATLYGLADGRVVNRFFQGALISGFRLDEEVEMEAGKTYGVDVRRGDGTVLRGVPVVNQPGVTRVLQFAAPRTQALSPRKGDLVIFGETGMISEDLEIVDIEPQEDMSVTFRAIPYIPDAIQEAINNPVPELPSKVTPRLRAPKPTLSRPESVDPMVGAAIKASIGHWDGTPVASFASRWRTTIVDAVDGPLTTPWASLESVSALDGVIRTGPITGAAHAPPDGQQVRIDIEVRTVLSNGEFSEATVLAAIPVLAQIPAPDSFSALGVQRTRSDGSSFGAIAVSATPISVGDILTLEIEVQKDDGSTWVTPTGGLIPARVATTDVLGLDVGVPGYNVRGRWIRSDNWPGPWATNPDVCVIPEKSDISAGLAPGAIEEIIQDVLNQVEEAQEDTETARRTAETILESILNGQQSLEAEAAIRLGADTGVLNEAKSHTDGKVAEAMNTVYTRAETDEGLASTLQSAISYTDDFKSEANLTFSTKAERASGDAQSVLTSKAYTDDFKSEASLTYATQAAMASGLAATLSSSQSYTNGQVASAMSTVYTKAEVDAGRANTLQEAKAYSDAQSSQASLIYATKAERANGDAQTLQQANSSLNDYKVEASLLYATQASLNGVSATAALALNTAVDVKDQVGEASFTLTAGSGGAPATIWGKAKGSTSAAGMVASILSFANVVGGAVVKVMEIIGGAVHITGKLFMGAAGQIELDPSYPLILWKFGNARLAIGQLPNDSLFFWFGAGGGTAVSAMRKNNAKVWFDTNGNSYWGGSIIAGTISNSGQGTLLSVPASFSLGPFATNGGPITVVWSYDYSRMGKRWGNQTGGVSGNTTALVRFYRKIGGNAEELLDSMSVTGTFNSNYDAEPVPGQPPGTQGQTFFTEYMGGSRTFTDNAGGTQSRTYRVEVVSRSTRYVPGDSNELDNQRQSYGVTSSE